MSAERKALLEISEKDVKLVELGAEWAYGVCSADIKNAGTGLCMLAERMRAALDAAKDTK